MSNPHLLEVAQSLNVILTEFIEDSKQLDDSSALCFPQTLPDGHCIGLFNSVSPKTPGIGYLLAEYSPELSDCVFKIIVLNYTDLNKSIIIDVDDPIQVIEIHRQLNSIIGNNKTVRFFAIKYSQDQS